jgi:lysosomal acid lipase/cholesteryl ester hydrolase
VQTEDGYTLCLHRIPGKKGTTPEKAKFTLGKPILLLHGFASSSNFWLVNSERKAPAFKFANDGYDVWMLNFRGNYYSRVHKNLDPDQDNKFWDFGLDELAKFDIPATVEYILKTHNSINPGQKLAVLGHSMGNSAFLAAASLNPQYYNDKISLFMAWAPVTRLDNIPDGPNKESISNAEALETNEIMAYNGHRKTFAIACTFLPS